MTIHEELRTNYGYSEELVTMMTQVLVNYIDFYKDMDVAELAFRWSLLKFSRWSNDHDPAIVQ